MRLWLISVFSFLSLSSVFGQEVYKYQVVVQGVDAEFLTPFTVYVDSADFLSSGQDPLEPDSLYYEFVTSTSPVEAEIRHIEQRYDIDTTYNFTLYPDSLNVLLLERPAYTIGTVEIQTSFTTLTGGAGVNRSSGYYLRKDQLNTRASNTLSEALDIIPGVHAANTGVGIGKPMIRGFVGNRVQVLQNGIGQEGQQWGMDHGLEIDQFATERISIVNGPAALVRGAGLQTGAVQVETDFPFDDYGFNGDVQGIFKSNNNLAGITARLGYGSNDSLGLRTGYGVRFSLQDFGDFRVPAENFLYNGFELPLPEGVLKNTAGRELNGSIFYGRQLNANQSVRLNLSRFSQRVGLFPGATGIPRAFDIGNIGDERNIETPSQETTHDRLGVHFADRRGNVSNVFTLGIQYNNRKELSQPHAHGLTYIDSSNTLALQLKLFTLDGKYDWSRSSYARDIKWGMSAQYQNNQQAGWEFLLPTFERVEGGVYGYYGWSKNRWNLNAAVRLDGANVDVTGHQVPWYAQPDSLVNRVEDFSRSFLVPSASFGWEYINGDFVFSGHTGLISRTPEANELASNGVHHGTFRHEIGNPDLNPEYGVNLDISTYYEHKNNLWRYKTKATVYTMSYWNFIYLNPSGRFSPLPDAGQIYSYVQSEMFQVGGELYAEVSRQLNKPSNRLSVVAMADFVRSQNLRTTEFLPFQPPASITGLTELSYGKWKYGAEVNYNFEQRLTSRNEPATEAYTLINAYASYTVTRDIFDILEISLRLQNITNQSYLRHLSRYRILNLPEQGFNLILQAKYSF